MLGPGRKTEALLPAKLGLYKTMQVPVLLGNKPV